MSPSQSSASGSVPEFIVRKIQVWGKGMFGIMMLLDAIFGPNKD
jgi:hypothetical protein